MTNLQRRWPAIRGREAARPEPVPVPDLTDFMNDRFFGAPVKTEQTAYNLSGVAKKQAKKEEEGGGGGRNRTSRMTQEWLDEAKRMVAATSPARQRSPAVGIGSPSPRFASSQSSDGPRLSTDRRDGFSRSARRNRVAERISDEILSKTSARHNRNSSDYFIPADPAAADHRRNPSEDLDTAAAAAASPLPPRQPSRRKSRFQEDHPDASPTPVPRRRSFKKPGSPSAPPPPPPEEFANHRLLLSPPRNLVESAQRRSISSSTCSVDRPHPSRGSVSSVPAAAGIGDGGVREINSINSFLRRQKAALARISAGEAAGKARIVLSGSATSTTSSMAAAICYAWFLENNDDNGDVVVPVVNMRRERMYKHRQAAWLFYHLGIDVSALLFADEVDLEGLIISRQLSILVVGQDVLKTNGEVGSLCTVLTDNYCEDAYNLLQTPNVKKLLLAGILLDTQNLNSATKYISNRDAEAVQLLLFGSAANYRHELFEQLMQDQRDSLFLEAMRRNYGHTSNEDKDENGVPQEDKRSSTSISPQNVNIPPVKQKHEPSPARAPAPEPAPSKVVVVETVAKPKNKFSLAKFFGFGSR